MSESNTMLYQIVFCDIDGTLIDSKHQISKDTRKKIQELYRMGIPFILVSARMPSGIFPLQKELEIKAPIICYSGALILNEHGACVKTTGIAYEKAASIYAFIKRQWPDVSCNAFCYNNWITADIHDKWVVQEQRVTTSVPAKGGISDLIPPEGHIHKFLCMGKSAQIIGINDILKEKYPELSIYRSNDTYLEIMEGDAKKSIAVKYLCDYYEVPIEASVSFGDNFNDADMLLTTGTSFAMGNAPEEVKRQARNVTLDNDREGVLEGLKQLNFLGNQVCL